LVKNNANKMAEILQKQCFLFEIYIYIGSYTLLSARGTKKKEFFSSEFLMRTVVQKILGD
jgi:hypothetical protein